MKINEIEQIVGITKRNIRFYEKEGLLLPGRNSDNGYRDYGDEEIKTLKTIKLLRKLGVPIEEIHKIQANMLTTEDALQRHLIKLERDSHNLSQLITVCTQMVQSDTVAASDDPDKYLTLMETMEKEGARFMNAQQKDGRKKTPAVIAAAVMIALMSALFGFLLWAFITEQAPLLLSVLILVLPLAVIVGVAWALIQRIKEIKGGEENAAAKY